MPREGEAEGGRVGGAGAAVLGRMVTAVAGRVSERTRAAGAVISAFSGPSSPLSPSSSKDEHQGVSNGGRG